MKRILVVLLLLGTVVLSLASCSLGKLNKENDTAANASISSSTNAANVQADSGSNAPATSGTNSANAQGGSGTNAPASSSTNAGNSQSGSDTADSTMSEASVQNNPTPAEEPADSDLSLESIKKAAQDAGYKVEDNQDLQYMAPTAVKGIIIDYQDEYSMSQIPVNEFSSPADAKAYAKEVNDQGYSLCVVNGKFLAVTDSQYGVILNDKKTSLIETWLKNKVMAYEEPALPQVSQAKDFAGACTRRDAIYNALVKLVKKSVIVYSKSLPAAEAASISTISFSMVSSSDLSFVSKLSEDQAKMDEVVKTWENYGCTDVKLKHDAANDYTMTGKRAGMDSSFNIHCSYSPEKDSLRILDKDGGNIADFFEFVPLGGDKYAFQNLYERAIVEYKDGKITSFTYSANVRTNESAYKPETVSIYAKGNGVDEAWVSKLGADKYEQYITFDGTKLKISVTDFTGKKIKMEINAE